MRRQSLFQRTLAILAFCYGGQLPCVNAHSQEKRINATVKRSSMATDQRNSLDTFLSNFAEAHLKPFKAGALSDESLIGFGYDHIVHNQRRKLKSHPDATEWASIVDVDATATKYFGVKVKKHHAIPELAFNGKEYGRSGAAGDGVPFAQVVSLTDLGNGDYKASLNIYERTSDSDPVNPHADPATMAKSGTPVELKVEMIAIMRSLGSGSQKHFILREFMPVGSSRGKSIRRSQMPLHDAAGNIYTFCYVCPDEKTHTALENDDFRPASWSTRNMPTGSTFAYGHYNMALIAPGQQNPIPQNVNLTEDGQDRNLLPLTFTTYVVRGGKGEPDLLVWRQTITGREAEAQVFMIDNGHLVRVKFQSRGKSPVPTESFYHSVDMKRIGAHRYWAYFIMSASFYEHWIWNLDASRHLLLLVNDIEARTPELPREAFQNSVAPPPKQAPARQKPSVIPRRPQAKQKVVVTDAWDMRELAEFVKHISRTSTWKQIKSLLPAGSHCSQPTWYASDASTGNRIIVSGRIHAELYFRDSRNETRQPLTASSRINQVWISVGNGTLGSQARAKAFTDALATYLGPPSEAKWETAVDPPLCEGWQATWDRAEQVTIEYSNLLWSSGKTGPTVTVWILPLQAKH
jgi:hypothetical protein